MYGNQAGDAGSKKLDEVLEAASAVVEDFDPNGSYTGRPAEENEKPVQDADDL